MGKRLLQISTLAVIYLMIFLPISFAFISTPKGLETNDITKTSVSLNWDVHEDGNFDKFVLYRDNVEIYSNQTTSYIDTGLLPDHTYLYQLSAIDETNYESSKLSLSTKTLTPNYNKPKISNISIIASTATTATIAWTTDINSTSVVSYRTNTGNKGSSNPDLVKYHELQIDRLTNGAQVYYKVSSCNEDNICDESSQYSFKAGNDVSKPSFTNTTFDNLAKKGPLYYYNSNRIDVTGVTKSSSLVKIFVGGGHEGETRADENGTFIIRNVRLSQSAPQNEIILKSTDQFGNTFQKMYHVKVDTIKPVLNVNLPSRTAKSTIKINGTVSKEVTIDIFLIPHSMELSTPQNLTLIRADSSGNNIIWDDVQRADSYNIFKDGVRIANTDQTGFTDREGTNGVTYKYKVCPVDDSCNQGPCSLELSVQSKISINQNNNELITCENNLATFTQKVLEGKFAFNNLITLQKGSQIIKIVATDFAGNTDIIEHTIIMNDEKPLIESVFPENVQLYVNSITDIDIRGKTQPNNTVKLWVNHYPDKDEDDKTKSDTFGNFEFKNVNFKKWGTFGVNFVAQGGNKPKLIEDIGVADLVTWFDTNKFYYLEAKNEVGLRSDYDYRSFETMTCHDGNFSWSIIFEPQYQSPPYLSVERLEDGTERLAFFFKLNYHGLGEDAEVTSVNVRSAELDDFQQNDPEFELTNIIARSMDYKNIQCDPTNTKCYVLARPPPVADLTKNWGFDDWKDVMDAIHNNLILPIKVSVTYNYEYNGIRTSDQTQEICKNLEYSVDNTKLDWSKLPDILVEDGVKLLNTSVDTLTDILDQAKPIIDTVGYVCVGSFIVKTFFSVVRRFQERMIILKENVSKITGTDSSICDKDEHIKKYRNNNNYLDMLSNSDLEECYQSLHTAWEWEAKLDYVYRWSCDRIFCPKTPAPWTAEKTLPDDKGEPDNTDKEIKSYNDIAQYMATVNTNDNECNQDLTTQGYIAKLKRNCKFDKDTISSGTTFVNGDDCYIFDNAYWAFQDTTSNVYHLKRLRDFDKDGSYREFAGSNTINAVRVDRQSGTPDFLMTARPGTCVQACQKIGFREDNSNQKWPKKLEGQLLKDIISGNKEQVSFELTKEDDIYCLYNYKGELLRDDKTGVAIGSFECDEKIIFNNIRNNYGNDLTISYNNAYYDTNGDCLPYLDNNPCQNAIDDANSLKDSAKASGIVEGKNKEYVDKSGNHMQLLTRQQCTDKFANAVSAEDMGITYGVDGGIGEELQQYIDSVNQFGNDEPEKHVTCCCWSDDNVVYGDYIEPQQEEFEWNYRYSKTRYIYEKEGTISNGPPDTAKYHPDMYFKERDYTSNFGQNHWVLKGKLSEIDPKTQHIGALQTACLTGLYARLSLLKNILTNIRDCIQSTKYNGDYSSQSCKHLFESYVCDFMSDVVMTAISGCSPFGEKKLFDPWNPQDEGIVELLSAGTSGLYEGVQSSITDLGDRYGDSIVDKAFDGGIDGAMQKACMAAFGYDWEIDFESIMDLAYEQNYKTNAMAIWPKREFLFINPSLNLPIYEYKGGVYVTPGCDIDGYIIDLACVNEDDMREYKNAGINCGKIDCSCKNNAESIEKTVASGGKITQGLPLDRAFTDVTDNSAYIYDHVKLTLQFGDEDDMDTCLPQENKDGIWYFPFTDTTPINLIGCEVSPTSGQVICQSGIAKELGFANIQLIDVTMPETVYIGDRVNADLVLNKRGEGKVCLKYGVYKGHPDDNNLWENSQEIEIPETTTYSGSDQSLSLSLFNNAPIPSNILGGTLQGRINSITANDQIVDTKPINEDFTHMQSSQKGKVIVKLHDKDGDGEFTCDGLSKDEYSIGSSLRHDELDINNNCIVSGNGLDLKVTAVIPQNPSLYRNGEISITYEVYGTGEIKNQQPLSLFVEAKLPGEDGSCNSPIKISTAQSTIVHPFILERARGSGIQGASCGGTGLQNQEDTECICGPVETLNCGGPNRAEKYCYKAEGAQDKSCHKDPDTQEQGTIESNFALSGVEDSDNYIITQKSGYSITSYDVDINKEYTFKISYSGSGTFDGKVEWALSDTNTDPTNFIPVNNYIIKTKPIKKYLFIKVTPNTGNSFYIPKGTYPIQLLRSTSSGTSCGPTITDESGICILSSSCIPSSDILDNTITNGKKCETGYVCCKN